MSQRTACQGLILLFILAGASLLAPGQQQSGTLQVRGYDGEVTVVRVEGRAYVDLEALARVTGAAVSFEGGRAVLTLPGSGMAAGSAPASDAGNGFSRPFMSSAIEALASMREWGSTLVVAIQNSYPLGNAIRPYRGRAADRVKLAAAAVTNADDRAGQELLQSEFDHVQAWSDKIVEARNTMSAANYIMSEDALQKDPMFQGIVGCGQHLAQMFGSGAFSDAGPCR